MRREKEEKLYSNELIIIETLQLNLSTKRVEIRHNVAGCLVFSAKKYPLMDKSLWNSSTKAPPLVSDFFHCVFLLKDQWSCYLDCLLPAVF